MTNELPLSEADIAAWKTVFAAIHPDEDNEWMHGLRRAIATLDRAGRSDLDWRICRLHGRAQDDPGHGYVYPDCENAGYDVSVAGRSDAGPDREREHREGDAWWRCLPVVDGMQKGWDAALALATGSPFDGRVEQCIHGVSEREECEHCGFGWEAPHAED